MSACNVLIIFDCPTEFNESWNNPLPHQKKLYSLVTPTTSQSDGQAGPPYSFCTL